MAQVSNAYIPRGKRFWYKAASGHIFQFAMDDRNLFRQATDLERAGVYTKLEDAERDRRRYGAMANSFIHGERVYPLPDHTYWTPYDTTTLPDFSAEHAHRHDMVKAIHYRHGFTYHHPFWYEGGRKAWRVRVAERGEQNGFEPLQFVIDRIRNDASEASHMHR